MGADGGVDDGETETTETTKTPEPRTTSLSGRYRRRRWRRRLLALAMGSLLPLILIELGVRLAWGTLVSPAERSLLEADSLSLGRALRHESLGSPALWMHQRGEKESAIFLADPNRGMRLKPNLDYEP